MAYIKPKFSLTSNSAGVTTDAGPYSIALALTTTPSADTSGRLTVDLARQGQYTTTSSPVKVLDGHDIMTAHGSDVWTPGSVGSFLYMKNMDTSGTDSIYVGIVSGHNPAGSSDSITGSDDPTAPHASTAGHLADTANTTLRTMTLKPGEFCFMPWDYTGDIYVENNAGDPILEWWLFDRG
tara:strand:- start:256 stop:798 length:543 start_codon:yes stop_codon:yes gene_type:complete